MLTENSFYSPDELYTLVYENSYKQYLRLIVSVEFVSL